MFNLVNETLTYQRLQQGQRYSQASFWWSKMYSLERSNIRKKIGKTLKECLQSVKKKPV